MATVPESGSSRPPMMRSSVDLPPPLGPSRAVSCPVGMLTLMSSRAVKVVSGNVLGETRTATLMVEEKYLNFDKGGAYATALLLTLVAVAAVVVVSLIRPKEDR